MWGEEIMWFHMLLEEMYGSRGASRELVIL